MHRGITKLLSTAALLLVVAGVAGLQGMVQARVIAPERAQQVLGFRDVSDLAFVARHKHTISVAEEVAGKQILEHRLITNKRACYLVYVAKIRDIEPLPEDGDKKKIEIEVTVKRIWSFAENRPESEVIKVYRTTSTDHGAISFYVSQHMAIDDTEEAIYVSYTKWIKKGSDKLEKHGHQLDYDRNQHKSFIDMYQAITQTNLLPINSIASLCAAYAAEGTPLWPTPSYSPWPEFGNFIYVHERNSFGNGIHNRYRCAESADRSTALFSTEKPHAAPQNIEVWQVDDALLTEYGRLFEILKIAIPGLSRGDDGYPNFIFFRGWLKNSALELAVTGHTAHWANIYGKRTRQTVQRHNAEHLRMLDQLAGTSAIFNNFRKNVSLEPVVVAGQEPVVVVQHHVPVPPAAAPNNQPEGRLERFKNFMATNANKHKKLLYFCAAVAGAIALRHMHKKRKQRQQEEQKRALKNILIKK